MGTIFAQVAPCGETAAKPTGANSYPLSTELAVLERDLTNPDYRAVLGTMIPTDLEAEWQRVATSDNYLVFEQQHGGQAKIAADPALRAAYERRRHIADTFLAMIREAYAKRHRRPPFDDRNEAGSGGSSARRTAVPGATARRKRSPSER